MHIYRLLFSYRLRILFPVRIVTAAFDQKKKKKSLSPPKNLLPKKTPPFSTPNRKAWSFHLPSPKELQIVTVAFLTKQK